MGQLKKALENATFIANQTGGVISEGVRTKLEVLRARYFIVFVVLFVFVVLVAALGMVAIALHLEKTEELTKLGVGTAMGVTVGGSLELMRRIWKEWSQADLILILLDDASETQVKRMIDKLIAKL
jgi:hypothetical protein